MPTAHLRRELEEESLARSRARRSRRDRLVRVAHHPRVLVVTTANLHEVDASGSEQLDLGHRVFERGGAVVRGIEFDADAEGCRDNFAGLGQDVEDEAGAFLGGAAVLVCAEVCLAAEELVCQDVISSDLDGT